jgi:hypothetical protein
MWDAIIAVLGFIGIYGILHYLLNRDNGGGGVG